MHALVSWFKSLPPALQTAAYAIETGVAAAVALFLGSLYTALTSTQGLAGFDWHGQLTTLELALGAAIIKAILDALKNNPPSQT